ncbi:MAG: PqqD family protein [Candidatus Altiarchaeota archaeon]
MNKPTRVGHMGGFGSIPTLLGSDGNKYYVSETVRDIWRLCDGRRSIEAIKRDLSKENQKGRPMPEDISSSLENVLDSLEEKHLIEFCNVRPGAF